MATVWPLDLLTGIFPLDAVVGAGTTSQVLAVLNLLIGGGLIVGLVFGGWSGIDRFVFEAALLEEVWFRLGSQSWSWRQRVRSCVGFSFAHVLHIILRAVTLGLLLLVGAVFRAVSLHQFRKTR